MILTKLVKEMKRLTTLLIIIAIVLLSCDNNVHQNTHRVTFDNCFGTKNYVNVKEGEAVSKPEDPVGDNTVGNFKSWVKDKEKPDDTIYDFSTPVTEDITLYATYYGLKTVTLQKPDGSEWKKIPVSYGSALNIEDDEIDGSIIECWLLDNREYDLKTPVTIDITLKAKCYTQIEKNSEQYRKILGLMELSQLFIESTGFDEGSDSTKGFANPTLARMYFAYTKNVDTETANTFSNYYDLNGTKYNLYLPYMDYKDFQNLLFYKVQHDEAENYTKIGNYRSCTTKDDKTSISFSDFKVCLHLDKGKYNKETGTVVQEDQSASYTDVSMNALQNGYITSDADNNITMEFVDTTKRFFERHNKVASNETIATLIMKNAGDSELTVEDYATKISFCNVTFDEENGTTRKEEVLKGNKVYKPKTAPTSPNGKGPFKEWALDGNPYDFSTPVDKNITLKATYYTEAQYEKILQAECIYNIATLLSDFDKLSNGETNPQNLYNELNNKRNELGQVLLSAKMSINKDEELYFNYDGKSYVFPKEDENIEAWIDTSTGYPSIKTNNSKKDGNSTTLDIDQFVFSMKFILNNSDANTYKDNVTFSFKATINGDVTKATLIKDGKTYPEVTVTKSEDQIKYEIEDITYIKSIR